MTNQKTTDDDTIVAISSPPGRGGVGVVRISGAQAARIALEMFRRPGPGAGLRAEADLRAEAGNEAFPPITPRLALSRSVLNARPRVIHSRHLGLVHPTRAF